jgi:hypothetical protein
VGTARSYGGWARAALLASIVTGTGCSEDAASSPWAGSEGTVTSPMSQVTLVANPRNTLSVVVSWTTDAPATSEVAFGDDGALAWRIADDVAKTDHRVVVYGLRAERDVLLQARSVFDDGIEAVSGELTWRTGALPRSVPVARVDVFDEASSQPGWTLTNVSNRDLDWPPTVVMYDAEGEPVWYAITAEAPDNRGDLDVSLTPAGTVLVGGSDLAIDPVELTLEGEVAWAGPEQHEPEQHHHFQRLPDGTTALLRQSPSPDRPDLILDRIEIIDADHEVVWSWDGNDHLDPPDGATGDWMHANAVQVTDDSVYLSCRDLSTIYRIDRATGDVVWTLGPGGDFAPEPGTPEPWFSWQHAPELRPDGSTLVYDNHGMEAHTRVLRLDVDEDRWTTSVTWEFPGDFDVDPWYRDSWYSPIWGDVDRLDNGNVLVTAGMRIEGGESRIFEVTPGGRVAWELRLPNAEGAGLIGVYRSQRIQPPGLVRIAPDGDRAPAGAREEP